MQKKDEESVVQDDQIQVSEDLPIAGEVVADITAKTSEEVSASPEEVQNKDTSKDTEEE
jgi:hypothetical protein